MKPLLGAIYKWSLVSQKDNALRIPYDGLRKESIPCCCLSQYRRTTKRANPRPLFERLCDPQIGMRRATSGSLQTIGEDTLDCQQNVWRRLSSLTRVADSRSSLSAVACADTQRPPSMNRSQVGGKSKTMPASIVTMRVMQANDSSSATRPTGRVDCNQSAMAGFAAALG